MRSASTFFIYSTVKLPTHETYTIVQGDTITRISIKNYGNTNMIDEICQLNHMSEEDLIYPGQKILLP